MSYVAMEFLVKLSRCVINIGSHLKYLCKRYFLNNKPNEGFITCASETLVDSKQPLHNRYDTVQIETKILIMVWRTNI